MDIATAVGLVAGFGTLVALIMIDGGNFLLYWDKHAAIVIFGGSAAVTMIRFPFAAIAHGVPMGIKCVFAMPSMYPRDLIEEITRIAEVVRKSGPIALENISVDHPFLAQGVRYIADGYDAEFIRGAMERDRDMFLTHLDEGQKIYRAVGDCAPAWGMIGTLIGMVNMFANMEDPSKLGPFMAVALLATLYGALVGNLIALPIADKMHVKLEEEEVARTLIIDGILQIREAKSPAVVKEMLLSYLPHHIREEMTEAAA